MANPYFQTITQRPQDFSMLRDAGNAWAKAYQQTGEAIGKVGSAYFERKGKERKIDDYMQTDGFKKKYLAEGGSPADLQRMGEDEKFRRQEGKRLIDSAGGIKEFEDRHTQQVLLDQQGQLFEEKMETSRLNQESLQNQLSVQKKALEKAQQKDEILNHYYRLNSEGKPTMNMDGFEKMSEYGATFSEVAKTHRIKGFSPMNFGEYLQKKSGIDYTDKRAVLNMVDEYAGASNASGEDYKRFQEIAEEKYVDPKEIQERAESKIFLDPSVKKSFEQVGNFGELSSSWRNAVGTNPETGERFVKSNVSANMLQRAMAKIGNGGGNMTDGDVNAISGATDWNTNWNRIYGKLFQAEGESEVASSLSAEDIDMIGQAGEAIYQHNLRKRTNAIKAGLKETLNSYPQLNMQSVYKHSGFSQFLPFDHMGNDTPTTEQIKTDNVDFLGNMQVADTDTLHAINRMIKEKGEQYTYDEFAKVNPSLDEDQIWERIKLSKKWEKNEVQSAGDMMVRGGGNLPLGSQGNNTGAMATSPPPSDDSEGIGATATASGLGGGVTTHKLQNKMRYKAFEGQFKDQMNPVDKYNYKKQVTQIEKGTTSDLRKAGKSLGMPDRELNKQFTPKQKEALRKKIKKKFEAKMKTKVLKFAGKVGLTGILKKYLITGVATVASGGIGGASANFIMTAMEASEVDDQATEETIRELEASASTAEEKAIVLQMKEKFEQKMARREKTKPRFEGGVYKGIGSYPLGQKR